MCIWRFVFFLMVGLSLRAELVWDSPEQQQSVSAQCGEAHFTFSFQNTGTNWVEITNVRKSCGCLNVRLDKKSYAPGESGTLAVTVDLTDRTGLLSKSLMVITSDPTAEIQRLLMGVDIPLGYKLTTRQLVWANDDFSAKSCHLINESTNSIPLVSVESKTPGFLVELIPLKDGFEYEVKIQPTDHADRSEIVVYTGAPSSESRPRNYKFSVIKQSR